jgi:cysteine-rich repeat protein
VVAEWACDAFVSKFAPDGSLQYSTFLGGRYKDEGFGIAVDGSGSAYVVGMTESPDFPIFNALQPVTGPFDLDAFVTRLAPSEDSLVFSTYFGGSGAEFGTAIALDESGNAYITGNTWSADFPTLNPLQPALAQAPDAFVAKISAAGTAVLYSTFLGGIGGLGDERETALGIAVDAAGSAYVVGRTDSPDFPTVNALQGSQAGPSDGFVAKVAPAGNALAYSTYLGGALRDTAAAVAVDDQGAAYVTGTTESVDFPTANALQGSNAGGSDAFVAKLSAEGQALAYSTYLGGGSLDSGVGIAVDGSRNAYVAGFTESADFPLADPLFPSPGPLYDAFLARIAADGQALVHSTYLDTGSIGLSVEFTTGVAIDGSGNAYIGGWVMRGSLPDRPRRRMATQGVEIDVSDAFVFKVADGHDETDVCGDGILQPGEQCDDGNTIDGDGCSSTCIIENHPPSCGAASPSRAVVWPPNHQFVSIGIGGVTDPDGEAVAIRIDAIRQDERVVGHSCGHTCPDGRGVGTATAKVRAERAGSPHAPGNGRVYHIGFTGSDAHGASCQGTVRVCVPHDQRPGSTCVDGGPLHDSTACH